jgi:DNA-binding transcriptional regulator YhcF (GntR family)
MADRTPRRIDKTDGAPAWYKQVANVLREEIELGVYTANSDGVTELPSAKKLAKRFGVSTYVTQRGIDYLSHDGIVQKRQGRPTRVAGTGVKEKVGLNPGDRVDTRSPDDAERKADQLGRGVKLYVVTRADGTEQCYPDNLYELVVPVP